MKKISKYILIISTLIMASSCEDYLNRPKVSDLPVEDVFKDFVHAQGFVEVMYRYVNNQANSGNQNDGSNFLMAEEVISSNSGMLPFRFDMGNMEFAVASNGALVTTTTGGKHRLNGWSLRNRKESDKRSGFVFQSLFPLRNYEILGTNSLCGFCNYGERWRF